VISVIQLLSVQHLAGTLPWSVRCFAFSIPFLAASVLIENAKALNENINDSKFEMAANMIGMVSTALGVVLLFFYLDRIAGILVTVASLLAFIAWWRVEN
jgi:hypothetical protein